MDPDVVRPLSDRPGPFSGFDEQARATLAMLRSQFAFERWMIIRRVDGQAVVELVDPVMEPVTPGSTFLWSQTICARMVDGQGPRVAPSVAAVPIYAVTPQCRQLSIGAYAGVPLYDREGVLWGTLCGTHSAALPESPQIDEPFLHWIARSLTMHLAPSGAPSTTETRGRPPGPSTILHPDMWSTVLDKEQERSARTGQSACVIELDVAGPDAETSIDLTTGDLGRTDLVERAAQLVAASARGCDFVTRTGTTRLRLLAVACSVDGARGLMRRLVAALGDSGIRAEASIIDVLPHAEAIVETTFEPAAITYMVCGRCRRRGAYVSPRFPVLRCKYCGHREELDDEQWSDSLRQPPT